MTFKHSKCFLLLFLLSNIVPVMARETWSIGVRGGSTLSFNADQFQQVEGFADVTLPWEWNFYSDSRFVPRVEASAGWLSGEHADDFKPRPIWPKIFWRAVSIHKPPWFGLVHHPAHVGGLSFPTHVQRGNFLSQTRFEPPNAGDELQLLSGAETKESKESRSCSGNVLCVRSRPDCRLGLR
jgi:hypothetical protein